MSDGQRIAFRDTDTAGAQIRGVAYDYPLPVEDPMFMASISKGGVVANNKFGFNPQINTSTDPETLWTVGGVFVKQLTAETVNVASSSAADAAAGTGARSVFVSYLTTDYAEAGEIVVLDGTNNVALSQPCIAINRMVVLTAGTGRENAGIIDATGASSGDIHAQIPLVTDEGDTIGACITQQLVYTVPAGKSVIIDSVLFNVIKTSGGGNPQITYRGFLENEAGVRLLWLHQRLDSQRSNDFQVSFPTSIPVGEKVTISIEAVTDTNGAYAGGRFWYREYTT